MASFRVANTRDDSRADTKDSASAKKKKEMTMLTLSFQRIGGSMIQLEQSRSDG
jgi:hypothetical protein